MFTEPPELTNPLRNQPWLPAVMEVPGMPLLPVGDASCLLLKTNCHFSNIFMSIIFTFSFSIMASRLLSETEARCCCYPVFPLLCLAQILCHLLQKINDRKTKQKENAMR